MKTTRFINGPIEDAKESANRGHGLANAPAPRTRTNAADQCATPTRPAGRQRATKSDRSTTRIAAKVDVGYGNTLFIRGEGAGLSWDKGQPLDCLEGSTWRWSSRPGAEPVTFKLLINDQLWCRGANMTAAAGSQAEVAPAF
jgi:hypothetical protein